MCSLFRQCRIDAAVSRLYRDSHGVLRVRRAQPNFDAEDVVQGVEQLHDSIAAAEQLDPDMQPVPLDQSGMPVSLSAYCGVSAIEEQAEAEECRVRCRCEHFETRTMISHCLGVSIYLWSTPYVPMKLHICSTGV